MGKTKILTFAALTLVVLIAFSACNFLGFSDSNTPNIADIVDPSNYVSDTANYTEAYELPIFDDYYYVSNHDGLIFMESQVEKGFVSLFRMVVYNAELGKVVFDMTETKDTSINMSFFEVNGVKLFKVNFTIYQYDGDAVNYDEYTTESIIYYADGSVFTTADYIMGVEVVADFLLLEGKYYSVDKNGRLEYAFDHPDFGKMMSEPLYASNDKYYYAKGNYDNFIKVYDKQLNHVYTYTFPTYTETSSRSINALKSGKIFIQYRYVVDQYSDDYDIFNSAKNVKYKLVTLLVDPATGEKTEIDCQYVIYQLKSEYIDCEYSVVKAVPIIDKRIDMESTKYMLATINDEGELGFIGGISGSPVVSVEVLNSQYWIAETADEKEFLMNSNGDVVGDISGHFMENSKYILSNGKIFDMELVELYDYGADGFFVAGVYENSVVLLTREDKYAVYNNGTLTVLWEKDDKRSIVKFGKRSFTVLDSSDPLAPRYIVYNAIGEPLLELDASLTDFEFIYYAEGENYEIIRVSFKSDEDNKTYDKYYRLH